MEKTVYVDVEVEIEREVPEIQEKYVEVPVEKIVFEVWDYLELMCPPFFYAKQRVPFFKTNKKVE